MEDESDRGMKRISDSEDQSVHWERCQQSRQKRVKQMEEEKGKFQSTLDIAEIDVVQPQGSSVVVTKSEKKIQFSYDVSIGTRFFFVACKPSLNSSGEGSFWKVTIDTLPRNNRLFLGINGNLNVSSKNTGWEEKSALNNGICEWSPFAGFS